MPDSFAGITVPEGNPDTIRDAAQTFKGVAGGLHGTGADLRSVPGLVADWKGPASAAFGTTVVTNGSCVDDGAAAMSTCAQAASTYADDLDHAQREARRAIHDARDAQRRIDAANADIEDAINAQISARSRIDAADQQIAASSVAGVPDAGALADRDAASGTLTSAQGAESDARRRLHQAQDDLEDAKKRGHNAMEDAKRAAHGAAGAFEAVAGHTPAAAVFGGSPHAIEDQVLARVRAGDYSVLDSVPLNYVPEDTQRAIAAEIAKESYRTSYNEGSHSMADMAGLVQRYEHDDEFATGFYNQLGGGGAYDLASNTYTFHGHAEGLQDPAVIALLAPFAALMATATRSRGLRSDFTDDLIGTSVPLRERLGSHGQLAAFVMAAPAAGYGSRFLSRLGREILVDPLDSPDVPGIVDISDHQDFIAFLAGNPEASGLLVAGHHGPGFSNVSTLLLYGARYTDDGQALGALLQAGTHDLRGTDLALSNDASHAVIRAVPELARAMPDGAKPALVTILDDHMDDFEYVAADLSDPGTVDRPAGGIGALTYDEAHSYLKTLVGDDVTRGGATHAVGERVADDIYRAAASGDTGYANRAGALSEMGVLATADAHLDAANTQDTMNGFAKSASGKLLGFTPLNKVPGFDLVSGKALDQIFSTDAVKTALDHQNAAQISAYEGVRRLSVEAQVSLGQLPPQARETINPNGTINVNFVDGPNNDQDVIRIDTNGDGEPDRNLVWDLDHDGKISAREQAITERDLYDASLGVSEAASQSITNLHHIHYDATHPPDIDDLELPAGYHNDNPNAVEKILSWPFDAPGEGTIAHDGHVVAHQGDLHWDGREQVYNLDVKEPDGTTTQLHYQRFDDKWKLVEKVGDTWQPVN
jgi:uncharacterized protein YukE